LYFQNQFWDEQKSFLWWKKRQRKKYLESALMILFLEVLAGTVCFYGQTETIELNIWDSRSWNIWGSSNLSSDTMAEKCTVGNGVV